MIEPIMFVGIGFLVAGLLVIGVIPLVHARAVRLTMRRLEALTPLSMAEIQADKDQLRAEFAMSTRRLEMSVEQMKAKTTSQLAEIGKKSEAIGRLKLELGEKTAALFALEAKEKQLCDDLQTTQAELAGKTGALRGGGARARRARGPSSSRSPPTSTSASVAADSQRVELVALRAQTEALKGQIDSYEKETKALWDRLNTQDRRGSRRQPTAGRGAQPARTIRPTASASSTASSSRRRRKAEVLGRRVQELAARLDEQGRLLADREVHVPTLARRGDKHPEDRGGNSRRSWPRWKTATASRWRPSRRRSR